MVVHGDDWLVLFRLDYEMNRKQIQRWKGIREKGAKRFVLTHGVFGWGIPMFITMTFLVNKVSLIDTSKILSSIGIWAIGGICFGIYMWKWSEKKYRESLPKEVQE